MNEFGVVESSSVPVVDEPLGTLEDQLSYTQKIRKKIVTTLVGDGKPPTDKEGGMLLLHTLKDMDAQTLGIMRQNTENDQARSDQVVARALLELSRRQGSRSMLRMEDGGPLNRALPPSDSELPEIQTVPGETDTGTQTITYNELAQRFTRHQEQNVIEHKP